MERRDVDLPSEKAAEVDTDAAPTTAADDGPRLADLLANEALALAVDEALIGDVLADLPEAQPNRTLRSPTDFSSLYVRHRNGLAAHARRYLRDPRDVDEVVQETFLRLFLAIPEIETEIQAIAFARRTLTNLCIDRYRADRRRPTLITLDASPIYDVTSADDEPDPVLQAEDAAIVREALSRLSPLHRAALVKREIEEKALPQIAAELGVAEESVKHLLFRARRALRRLLIGTTVEPGIDLSEATAGLPPQRSTSPLLRNTTAFVFFLVGALVVATGVRPLFSSGGQQGRPSTEAIGPSAPILGLPGVHPIVGKPGAKAHRLAKPGSRQRGAAQTILPVSPLSSSNVQSGSRHKKSSATRHVPVHHPVSRGSFKLSGPLNVTGRPHIRQGGVSSDSRGTRIAASSFTAPTDQGTFELTQSVTTSKTGGTSVTMTPAFLVGDAVEAADVTGSTAHVDVDDAGNVTVDVVVNARPDPSTNAFPLTSLTAHFELSPALDQVLSETVALTAQQPSTPPSQSGGGAPPASGTPGSGTPASGTPDAGSSGTDQGSGAPPTSGTGTPSSCPATGAGSTGTSAPPAAGCQPADTGASDTDPAASPTGGNAQPA